MAYLFEHGPFTVAPGGQTLVPNPYSWNLNATVIYLDSPVGTGFSYVTQPNGYAVNEKQIADDVYTALQGIMSEFPEYQPLPFFVFGESYAGHYVPAVSSRILLGNKKRTGVTLNMQGLSIGNGMTFPRLQYGKYADFSVAHGLISFDVKQQLDATYKQCEKLLLGPDPRGNNATNTCQSILDTIQSVAGNFNVYDVTKSCVADLCYAGMTDVNTYLNRADVMKALGVAPFITQWTSCNNTVYGAIATPDWFNQEAYTIPFLLDSYRVMIVAGQNDWICNHLGNQYWVSKLDWNHRGNYNAAPRNVWSSPDGLLVKGYVQQYGPLSFVSVVNAGHMVPHDQPANALEYFRNFLFQQPFQQPPSRK